MLDAPVKEGIDNCKHDLQGMITGGGSSKTKRNGNEKREGGEGKELQKWGRIVKIQENLTVGSTVTCQAFRIRFVSGIASGGYEIPKCRGGLGQFCLNM